MPKTEPTDRRPKISAVSAELIATVPAMLTPPSTATSKITTG